MTSHSNAGREEPTTVPPTTDSNSDGEEDVYSDWSDVDDQDLINRFSTAYVRGSRDPMKKPLTAPCCLPISDADLEKLRVGHKARDMEDRWEILMEDPDEKGGISLHILRSWLQEECYILHIVPKPPSSGDGDGGGGSASIQSITWEGDKGGWQCEAEQAMKEAVMVCRSQLDCEFETLPDYPASMFWDSNAYKKVDAA